jgi:hypothetical protein
VALFSFEESGALDLVVVGEPEDRLAAELAARARAEGRSVLFAGIAACIERIVVATSCDSCRVDPDVPMLLRLPPPPATLLPPDEAFHRGERLAMLWAAAALCRSPVINRPGTGGFSGRCSPSAALTEIRAGVFAGRTEVFSRVPPPPAGMDATGGIWCLQDTVTHSTTCWPDVPVGIGPYRARPVDPDEAYELVTVVGESAWRASTVPLESLALEARSIALVAALELTFAVVTWAVSRQGARGVPARVNPFPTLEQVRHVWPEVASTLLRVLRP